METEIWKSVIGWEGWYEVSDMGNVRSITRKVAHKRKHSVVVKVIPGKLLKPNIQDGYHKVKLLKEGYSKGYLSHVLVARAFISDSFTYPEFEVNHKDMNRGNNKVGNLEWMTKFQNQKHACLNNPDARRGNKSRNKKIDYSKAVEIRVKYSTGLFSFEHLAKEYGLNSGSTICNIVKNKSWKTA